MPNGKWLVSAQYKTAEAICSCEDRYWWDLNQGPSLPVDTYQYHMDTYGPNIVYDDFIQNFTANAWDPKEWVDLFADAGANYFVQVSKHHDGYAIFDLPSNVTNRTSVAQFPHRNLLQVGCPS
jgi:alpha-L-fucosidase